MEFGNDATPAAEAGSPRPAGRGRRGSWWLVAGWAVVIAAFASLRALGKPLWYDELFSFYLAQLPTIGDLWSALASGTDLNPPLHYVAVRGSFAALGPGALALRLPSVVGYAIMSICLYLYVKRRLAPEYAWTAATFPLLTQAYSYAHEGRPYGLVLGFSGLALLGWQAAADGRRAAGLALMTLALAAAVSTHFFAVLLFVPIGMGELARAWSRKRVDLPLWIGLVLGLVPLYFLKDLIRASSVYKGSFWSKPSWAHNVLFYLSLLKDTGVPLLLSATIGVVVARFAAPARIRGDIASGDGNGAGREPVPLHEWVAMLGLIALPVIGFVVARATSGGAFTERYALDCVLGFGLLLAYGGDRLAEGRRMPGVVMALTFFGWFLVFEGYQLRPGREPHLRLPASHFGRAQGNDLPLVISRSAMYLQSYHDLPPALAARLVFVIQGRSTDEVALAALSRWVPLRVIDAPRFLGTHPRFFLCGYPGDAFFRALLEGDATLTMIQSRRYREGEAVLVRVERREGAGSSVHSASAPAAAGRVAVE